MSANPLQDNSILLLILEKFWVPLWGVMGWFAIKQFKQDRDIAVSEEKVKTLAETLRAMDERNERQHKQMMEYIREMNTAQNEALRGLLARLSSIDAHLRNGFNKS